MGRKDGLRHAFAFAVRATEQLDRTFAALAEPNRRAVIDLLRQRPHRAGELADALAVSPPALSKHLKALRTAGVVEESPGEFDARVRVYSLRDGALAQVRQWLDDTERMWSNQLAAFKAHIEADDAP